MTAVANTAFTAAQFNLHVRDNLNETAPAKATTAGRIFVATGANSIAERAIETSIINTQETTTSTTFADLTTAGPAVTLTTGTQAIIVLTANLRTTVTDAIALMAFAISGATTVAATEEDCLCNESNEIMQASMVTFPRDLTAGSNTFTAKYRVSAGTGTFLRRRLTVIAL